MIKLFGIILLILVSACSTVESEPPGSLLMKSVPIRPPNPVNVEFESILDCVQNIVQARRECRVRLIHKKFIGTPVPEYR